jgi:cation:H+ antiporter
VLIDVLSLVLGIGFAAVGGELFVRGLVGVSAWARVPAGVIGATVAAFATSSPELTVALNAAAEDRPEIALGDALGSNMVNLGVAVGLLLLAGTTNASDLSRRDAFTGLALVLLLALMVIDGDVARTDGLVLNLCFAAWLAIVIRQTARLPEAQPHGGSSQDETVVAKLGERLHGRSVIESLIGLGLLVAAGRLLVIGAKGIGAELGLSTFVVGVVLVSLAPRSLNWRRDHLEDSWSRRARPGNCSREQHLQRRLHRRYCRSALAHRRRSWRRVGQHLPRRCDGAGAVCPHGCAP